MYRRLRLFFARFLSALRGRLRKFRSYIEITGASEIARRYFVMNAFDGVLTILGIIIGAIVAKEVNPKIIVGAGLGASLAMGISGALGAYLTERAERRRNLKDLERHMLRNLEGSIIDKASLAASLWVALIDGLSPALVAVLSLIPFFMVLAFMISIEVGLIASIAINLFTLFILGIFLGRVSKGNMWVHGILMVGVGVLMALILLMFFGI
ncbi:MAG: VIT1/CCC1 transporter family protein [Candidatus Bathyarchaeia archaeon]